MMVQPSNNDQVFKAARDEQLAALNETQVARSQKRSIRRIPRTGLEDPAALFIAAPVAARDARPRNPDLTHNARH